MRRNLATNYLEFAELWVSDLCLPLSLRVLDLEHEYVIFWHRYALGDPDDDLGWAFPRVRFSVTHHSGRAWVHELEVKLAEAGMAGYQGVEIFWEDLVYAAKKLSPDSDEKDEPVMLQAAQHARELCDQNGLSVLVLQPFMNYEGLLDQSKHDELVVKLRLWFKVVKILGTDLIQIPSQVCSL
jgi:hypothetical protein